MDNGQGNMRGLWSHMGTQKGILGLLLFLFLHSLMCPHSGLHLGRRAGSKEQPTEHREGVKCERPHTEPGTFYTIRKGTQTKPLEIKRVYCEAHACSPSPPKAQLSVSNSLLFYSFIALPSYRRKMMHTMHTGHS